MNTFEKTLKSHLSSIPKPSLSVLSSISYSKTSILSQPSYHMTPQKLDNETCINLCNKMMQYAADNFQHKDSARVILLLALNIRKPEDMNDVILPSHDGTNTVELGVNHLAGMRSENSTTTGPVYDRSADDIAKEVENLINSGEGGSGGGTARDGDFNSATVPYGTFLAAYLMKLIVKNPENVMLGMTHMKERFLGFYPEKTSVEVNLSSKGIESLKNKIVIDQKLVNTWIFSTAKYEFTASAKELSAGVIRFLANLQFGYHAMPAYDIFRELLIKTTNDPADWIVDLWLNITKDALIEIANILKDYESIEKDGVTIKRDPYFKYARIVDPQYFLSLQPNQCACLIWIIVGLLNHYCAYSALGNPNKMMVLSKIGEKQKQFLNCVIEVIVEKRARQSGGETTVAIEAAKRQAEGKKKNDEDEMMLEIEQQLAGN
nr:nucleocapsid protein [Cytorhabdovirus sp.]